MINIKRYILIAVPIAQTQRIFCDHLSPTTPRDPTISNPETEMNENLLEINSAYKITVQGIIFRGYDKYSP
jgi:hypothetical protein